MSFSKPMFLYRNILKIPGSALTATNEATDYGVGNVADLYPSTLWKANDTTSPMYINFDAGSGKILNGDFETGDTTGWTLYVNTGAGATASFSASAVSPFEGSYKCAVSIGSGGASINDVQLIQQSKTITAGKKQYIKLAAKCATGTRDITVTMIKGASPYTDYTVEGVQVKGLTTSEQVFDIVFTANTTAADAGLRFLLGGSGIDVDFDIISWWEEGEAPIADTLAILGQNFATAGCDTVGLHYSDTNFATNTDAFTPFEPTVDGALLKTFAGDGLPHKYWRFYMTGHASAPQMGELYLGQSYTLPEYFSEGHDRERHIEGKTNVADGGQKESLIKFRRNVFPCSIEDIRGNTQDETDFLAWRDAVEDGTPFWFFRDMSNTYELFFVSLAEQIHKAPYNRLGYRTFSFTLEEEL